jgi:hypothetical protein
MNMVEVFSCIKD